jgi:hypothetical protein
MDQKRHLIKEIQRTVDLMCNGFYTFRYEEEAKDEPV